MQVAAQPPPLLFPRGDQPRPGRVQRPPQRHRVGGRAGLPGQVGQQPLVVGAKLLAARPRAHQEPPDGLPLEGQRERDHLRRGLAVRGGRAPPVAEPQLERRVRQPQAVRDGLDHRAAAPTRGRPPPRPGGRAWPGPRTARPGRRRTAGPPALHPVVQRPQRARGQHGRDDLHGAGCGPARRTPSGRRPRRPGRPRPPRGQQAVQHRPAQQDVDLVQPVPQDRDADRDRHQDAGQQPRARLPCPGRPGWRSARRW